MSKPVPTDKERSFDISELFFSTTDKRGVILNGNDVFVRISGYEHSKMIGAPHSIIRHPDMPRIVFKVLWDTIQAGKMIAAYVKNMAADGGYYWVLAVVFPVGDKYLSIRLKPTTGLHQAAEAVYKEVLKDEEVHGMEASANVLFKMLGDAGFATYDQFMTSALVAELKARDEAVHKTHPEAEKEESFNSRAIGSSEDISHTLNQISHVSTQTSQKYRNLFSKITEFDETSKSFREQVDFLLNTFHEFQLLSLNMRVFAAQIGAAGASIGVVAENFQRLVSTIEEYLQGFSKTVEVLCQDMQKLTLEVGSLKVQIDMVDFFVRASLHRVLKQECDAAQAFLELEEQAPMFKSLSSQFNGIAHKGIQDLRTSSQQFLSTGKDIKKFVNGIELISQIGAVEAARLSSTEKDFSHYIETMHEFSNVLRGSTQKMIRSTRTLVDNIHYIDDSLQQVSGSMDEVFTLAFSLNKMSTKKEAA